MACIVIHKNKKTGVEYAYQSTCSRDPLTKKPVSKKKYLGKWDPITKTIIPTNRKKSDKFSKSTESEGLNDISKSDEAMDSMESKESGESRESLEPTESTEIFKFAKSIESVNPIDSNDSNDADKSGDFGNHDNEIGISTRIIGPRLLLDLLAEELKILPLLRKIFPKTHSCLLSIVYYIVENGTPLHGIGSWSQRYAHPFDGHMTGPGIGEFLSEISPDDIQKFLYLWLKNLNDDKFLFYDITSISSYEKSNFIARRGYNHDHEKLEQINLSLLFGQHSMLPAHYRITRGNMDDVSTMEKTFEYLNFLDIKHPTYVLGRDFHGKDNVSPLLEKDFKFVMPLPPNQFWVETIIDSYHDAIKLPDNHHKINDGESIFAIKQHINYFDSGRRLYLHIYHQPEKKDNDFKVLIENTTKLKEQIESGEIPDQFLIENYKQFLIVSKRGHKEYSVEYDDDKILKHKDGYCGFFCVLSPNIKDSLEALAIYGNKHKVEKSFDDIKNSSDVKRLGIHKELRFEARLFIQFISLIFTSKLRAMTKGATNGIRYLSVDDIFDCLKMLQKTEFKGKYARIFNEPDRQTKKILDFFGINRPPR